MIKAVVFDLDDTLISEKDYIRSGFKVVSRDVSNRYSLNEDEVFNRMIKLFEESSKEVFNRLLNSFSIQYSKEEILRLIRVYREHTPDIKFFDDVIPTISELKSKGYKLGLITDGYKESQNKKIEVLKCKEIFDEIIVTDEIGREFWKPHEKSYRLMAERLDIKFSEMIYIGDNVTKDFVTANKLGIKTIYIDRENAIYNDLDVPEDFLAKFRIKEMQYISINL